MSVTIGLDFGGYSTAIYVKEKGIVLREPSIAAVDAEGRVIAVGTEALLIRSRAPGSVTIRQPFEGNRIADFNLTAEMLDRFLEIAVPRTRKHILAALKYGVSGENREMLRNALRDCRSGRIDFADAPLAALGGSGYAGEGGVIVCDLGACSVETSYIRDGEILRSELHGGGGLAADGAIVNLLRQKYGLKITPDHARAAKHKLSLSADEEAVPVLNFSGVDSLTGLPRRAELSGEELLLCLEPHFRQIADGILAVLNNLPTQGLSRSSAEAILLTGGGAQMPGLTAVLGGLCGREVTAAENPQDCTVRGLGKMIEQRDSGR